MRPTQAASSHKALRKMASLGFATFTLLRPNSQPDSAASRRHRRSWVSMEPMTKPPPWKYTSTGSFFAPALAGALAVEALEQARQVFASDRRAGIGDAQGDLVADGFDVHVDHLAGRGVLDGVVQQIRHHLDQAGVVGVDHQRQVVALGKIVDELSEPAEIDQELDPDHVDQGEDQAEPHADDGGKPPVRECFGRLCWPTDRK